MRDVLSGARPDQWGEGEEGWRSSARPCRIEAAPDARAAACVSSWQTLDDRVGEIERRRRRFRTLEVAESLEEYIGDELKGRKYRIVAMPGKSVGFGSTSSFQSLDDQAAEVLRRSAQVLENRQCVKDWRGSLSFGLKPRKGSAYNGDELLPLKPWPGSGVQYHPSTRQPASMMVRVHNDGMNSDEEVMDKDARKKLVEVLAEGVSSKYSNDEPSKEQHHNELRAVELLASNPMPADQWDDDLVSIGAELEHLCICSDADSTDETPPQGVYWCARLPTEVKRERRNRSNSQSAQRIIEDLSGTRLVSGGYLDCKHPELERYRRETQESCPHSKSHKFASSYELLREASCVVPKHPELVEHEETFSYDFKCNEPIQQGNEMLEDSKQDEPAEYRKRSIQDVGKMPSQIGSHIHDSTARDEIEFNESVLKIKNLCLAAARSHEYGSAAQSLHMNAQGAAGVLKCQNPYKSDLFRSSAAMKNELQGKEAPLSVNWAIGDPEGDAVRGGAPSKIWKPWNAPDQSITQALGAVIFAADRNSATPDSANKPVRESKPRDAPGPCVIAGSRASTFVAESSSAAGIEDITVAEVGPCNAPGQGIIQATTATAAESSLVSVSTSKPATEAKACYAHCHNTIQALTTTTVTTEKSSRSESATKSAAETKQSNDPGHRTDEVPNVSFSVLESSYKPDIRSHQVFKFPETSKLHVSTKSTVLGIRRFLPEEVRKAIWKHRDATNEAKLFPQPSVDRSQKSNDRKWVHGSREETKRLLPEGLVVTSAEDVLPPVTGKLRAVHTERTANERKYSLISTSTQTDDVPALTPLARTQALHKIPTITQETLPAGEEVVFNSSSAFITRDLKPRDRSQPLTDPMFNITDNSKLKNFPDFGTFHGIRDPRGIREWSTAIPELDKWIFEVISGWLEKEDRHSNTSTATAKKDSMTKKTGDSTNAVTVAEQPPRREEKASEKMLTLHDYTASAVNSPTKIAKTLDLQIRKLAELEASICRAYFVADSFPILNAVPSVCLPTGRTSVKSKESSALKLLVQEFQTDEGVQDLLRQVRKIKLVVSAPQVTNEIV